MADVDTVTRLLHNRTLLLAVAADQSESNLTALLQYLQMKSATDPYKRERELLLSHIHVTLPRLMRSMLTGSNTQVSLTAKAVSGILYYLIDFVCDPELIILL